MLYISDVESLEALIDLIMRGIGRVEDGRQRTLKERPVRGRPLKIKIT